MASLLTLLAGALVVLWAADMVRRLGAEGSRSPTGWACSRSGWVRALILVMLPDLPAELGRRSRHASRARRYRFDATPSYTTDWSLAMKTTSSSFATNADATHESI